MSARVYPPRALTSRRQARSHGLPMGSLPSLLVGALSNVKRNKPDAMAKLLPPAVVDLADLGLSEGEIRSTLAPLYPADDIGKAISLMAGRASR